MANQLSEGQIAAYRVLSYRKISEGKFPQLYTYLMLNYQEYIRGDF